MVDLVVPAYKDSPFLAECIESLRNQNSTRCRVLIVTSTPSPYIQRVAEEYDVPVLVSPRPSGIASDWNFALESATAPFVTICHQDDIYQPDYSTAMLKAIQASDDVLIALCGNTEHTSSGPRPIQLNLRVKRLLLSFAFGDRHIDEARRVRWRLLSFGNPVCCPGVMFNRRLLSDFRFVDTLKSNLDWDAWDRICAKEGKVAYVRDSVVSHRVHEGSETSASIASNVRLVEDFGMFQRYWPAPVCKLIMAMYKRSYSGNRA
ncbi:MAG: glycosyltransferase family 2 protein [Ottowia sp.]|nr:glycosyltransferase family 2 protein [Ottowia sp.]